MEKDYSRLLKHQEAIEVIFRTTLHIIQLQNI